MIWLSISLFCSKQNWHTLMANGVDVFLKNNSVIKGFRIELNYLYGENLRLALLTEEENARALANVVSNYFIDHFKKTGISKTTIKTIKKGIFMSFPENSIQFGHFPPEIISKGEMEHHSFSTPISKAMLNAFMHEEIDDEMILTFAFYLHIVMIKTFYVKGITVNKIFSLLANTTKLNEPERQPVKYEMFEITQEIMQSNMPIQELDWLNNWYIHCLSTLSIYEADLEKEAEKKYFLFINSLNSQLGITNKGKNYLSDWIKSSIIQYFSNNRIKEEI